MDQFLGDLNYLAPPPAAGGGGGSGDIEGVTAGSGLTGGGTSGTVSLAVDHASVAPEKQGTAAVGSATRSAREDHVHPFRSRYWVAVGTVTNLAASATTNSTQFITTPRAGKVTHIFVDANVGFPTTGSFQVQVVTVTGLSTTTAFTAAGEILTMTTADTDSRKLVTLASPISITAGQTFGFRCVATADLAPATLDPRVVLMFEED